MNRPMARFKRRTFHVSNLMQMSENNRFFSFALDSAHEKSNSSLYTIKSPAIKILCVLYLHNNAAFMFKWCGNTWNETFYFQRV